MRALRTVVPLVFLIAACSPPGGNGGTGGGSGGGGGAGGGGGGAQNQGVTVVDATTTERLPLAMAVGPNDRVGIAYFVKVGPSVTRPSVSDYALKYAEWSGGQVSTPQTVVTVQRVFGLSLAFSPSGEPAVTYLGGGDDSSIYWFQSDAVVNQRSGGTTWTETTLATRGDDVLCGNGTCAPTSDRGLLVGLNPAILFLGNGTRFVAWRDGHDGQFPQQDWAASDLESMSGTTGLMVAAGGNTAGTAKPGWGGHIQMILGAGGQPVIVSDHVTGSADGFGAGVYFHSFNGTAWNAPKTIRTEAETTNNQTGPSIAYAANPGYGIAFVNRNTDALQYLQSTDGNSWSVPDVLFQNGSGGWFPSIAFDPAVNEPTVAFYVCSLQSGAAEGTCPESQDDLRVAIRGGGGQWNETVIDTEGGYMPKLSFLSNNKRVIAYRHPTTYAVKLYVEP